MRHIISYLNSTGGIFYLGIEHKSQKEAIYLGLTLNQKIKLQMLSWVLNEVVMKIYPPDEQNQEQDEKQQQDRMQIWRQGKLSSLNSKSK